MRSATASGSSACSPRRFPTWRKGSFSSFRRPPMPIRPGRITSGSSTPRRRPCSKPPSFPARFPPMRPRSGPPPWRAMRGTWDWPSRSRTTSSTTPGERESESPSASTCRNRKSPFRCFARWIPCRRMKPRRSGRSSGRSLICRTSRSGCGTSSRSGAASRWR